MLYDVLKERGLTNGRCGPHGIKRLITTPHHISRYVVKTRFSCCKFVLYYFFFQFFFSSSSQLDSLNFMSKSNVTWLKEIYITIENEPRKRHSQLFLFGWVKLTIVKLKKKCKNIFSHFLFNTFLFERCDGE